MSSTGGGGFAQYAIADRICIHSTYQRFAGNNHICKEALEEVGAAYRFLIWPNDYSHGLSKDSRVLLHNLPRRTQRYFKAGPPILMKHQSGLWGMFVPCTSSAERTIYAVKNKGITLAGSFLFDSNKASNLTRTLATLLGFLEPFDNATIAVLIDHWPASSPYLQRLGTRFTITTT